MKITPTEILEYYFCPRFIYFMDVLKIPQYEERRFKVRKGREEHEKRKARNKDYLWKKIEVVDRMSDVPLESEKYRLRGIVDEVVTLADGTMAPIDYKFTLPEKTYKSHKMQIYVYCLLIEELFDKPVKRGYIFYVRNGFVQKEVLYGQKERKRVIDSVKKIFEILEREKIPEKTKNKLECADCTYKNICV